MKIFQVLYGYSIVIDLLTGTLFVFSQVFLTTPRLAESFILAVLCAVISCRVRPSFDHPSYPFAFDFSVRPFLRHLVSRADF